MAVSIVKKSDTTFDVTVEWRTTTKHTVTVTMDYYQKLAGNEVSVERLMLRSFDFLPERLSRAEPPLPDRGRSG